MSQKLTFISKNHTSKPWLTFLCSILSLFQVNLRTVQWEGHHLTQTILVFHQPTTKWTWTPAYHQRCFITCHLVLQTWSHNTWWLGQGQVITFTGWSKIKFMMWSRKVRNSKIFFDGVFLSIYSHLLKKLELSKLSN